MNGADANTWGSTNHYAYNPQGSGSGDPLDIVLGSRNIKPGNMIGGRRRYRRKRVTRKRRKGGRKKNMKGGELADNLNIPGNWLRNQVDRLIAGGSKKRRKSKKHSRKKRKVKRKRSTRRHRRKRAGKAPKGFSWSAYHSGAYNKPQLNPQDEIERRRAERAARRRDLKQFGVPPRSQTGGYKGDMPFQNAVNLVRGAGTSLGNVVHGFRGFPELTSPYPTEQPGMDPPRLPIPEPADIETLYKTAQVNVGAIGSRA